MGTKFVTRLKLSYSEEDLLLANAEWDHDRLIHLTEGQIQSTDPAFAAPKDSSSYPSVLGAVTDHADLRTLACKGFPALVRLRWSSSIFGTPPELKRILEN
jgi:hypothetical protein